MNELIFLALCYALVLPPFLWVIKCKPLEHKKQTLKLENKVI